MDIEFRSDGKGINLVNGSFNFLSDRVDLVCQRLFIALRSYKGNWFLDQNYGIDWLNSIFGKNKIKFNVDSIITNVINDDPYVDYIISFESEIGTDRTYRCSFTVKVNNQSFSDSVVGFRLIANEQNLILIDDNGNKFSA